MPKLRYLMVLFALALTTGIQAHASSLLADHHIHSTATSPIGDGDGPEI